MKTGPAKNRSMRLVTPSSQAGAIAVELAFVMVVMLLIVAGMIGFGRAFWYADALTKATRDGARLMSTWEVSGTPPGISATGVLAAQTITRNGANAANVSPPLGTAGTNVLVECLTVTFAVVDCAAEAPANVKVSITDFNVSLGQWFPFIGTSGVILPIRLSPHTTMRYMN